MQTYRRKSPSIYCVCLLFKHSESNDECVISGMLPEDIMGSERTKMRQNRTIEKILKRQIRDNKRKLSTMYGRKIWDISPKSKWTYRLLLNIENLIKKSHVEVSYYWILEYICLDDCHRTIKD